MIYKFKFQICNDDNRLLKSIGEESGLFWRTLNSFLAAVLKYAKDSKIGALE